MSEVIILASGEKELPSPEYPFPNFVKLEINEHQAKNRWFAIGLVDYKNRCILDFDEFRLPVNLVSRASVDRKFKLEIEKFKNSLIAAGVA